MRTIDELKSERERIINPALVKVLSKSEHRMQTAKLRLIQKAIHFLLCEPNEDFVKKQLALIEKKMTAIRELANQRVKAHGYITSSTAQKIRMRVYKEEGLGKLREQRAYVGFILN